MTNKSLINNTKSLNQIYKFDVNKSRTYEEAKIDLDIFKKVINNLDNLKDCIGLCYDAKTCQRIEWSGTKTVLTETYKKKKKSLSVSYAPTKKNPKGRHFSKEKSLQGMSRTLRHLICHENYTDIDIKNCHPVVFIQLCKQYNFDCSHISFYINNRESCLNELINTTNFSRDECKQSMLSLLNGGSCNKIFNNFQVPEWFSNFAEQIDILHEQFVKHDDLKDCVKEVRKEYGIDIYNFNGKVLNRLLCRYENIILQHAIQYCSLNSVIVASPQFDGFICENNPILNQEFLQKLNKFVLDETGFEVEFCIKVMDEHIPLMEKLKSLSSSDDIPISDDENKPNDIVNILLGGKSDLQCAEIFYEYNKNHIYYSNVDGYVLYNEKEKLWRLNCEKTELTTLISYFFREQIEKNQDEIIKRQTKHIQKQINKSDDDKEISKLKKLEDNILLEFLKLKNECESFKWTFGVFKHLENIFKKNHNTDFILENFDNLDDLYPFGYNVLDFRTKEIRERKFEDYFSYTNDTEYIPIETRRTDDVIKYLKDIWGTDDDIYVKNASQIMAYNLCGRNDLKKIVFHLGNGDNGKSVFINLNASINKSQVVAPERAFIKKNNESVLQTELQALIKKRTAIVNEPDEGKQLNENIMKQISGGDHNVQIRTRADRGYSNTIIKCKQHIILNLMLIIKCKTGMNNRLLVMDYPNKFEKCVKKEKFIMNLKNDYFSYLVDILHEMYQNDFNITYCKQITMSTEREKISQDSLKLFIDENIEFTDNPDDLVSAKTFNQRYEDYCYYNEIEKISYNKVGKRLLKEHGYDQTKKKHSRDGAIYMFMKFKTFEEETEEIYIPPL
jgi:hypothetical protein